MPEPTHGTRASYRAGCRCTPCKAANATYQAIRRARLARSKRLLGQRVPAAPAWRLVAALIREGFTRGQIAQLMGCRRPILELNPETVELASLAKLKQIYRVRYLQ